MDEHGYMSDEQAIKSRFVQEELSGMLRAATGGFVKECRYEPFGSFEIVNVATSVGLFKTDTFAVNVTGDSLWAIAKDVMAAVAQRFE